MPSWLEQAVRIVTALVLLQAGAAKLATPRSLRGTLDALGVPAVPLVAAAVPGLEIVTAAGLLLAPSHLFTPILVAGLGTVFAAAALRAILTQSVVSCACFGTIEARLGVRQIVLLPAWLGVAGMCLFAHTNQPTQPVAFGFALIASILPVRTLIPLALRNRTFLREVATT